MNIEDADTIEDSSPWFLLGYTDPVTVRKLVERIWPETNNRPQRAIIQTGTRGKPARGETLEFLPKMGAGRAQRPAPELPRGDVPTLGRVFPNGPRSWWG